MDKERARENAERYFAALRRFDLDAVAECFTEDAFYSHPPYDSAAAERAEAVGPAAIVALLRTKRGPRPVVQEIRHCVVDGELVYLEGIAYPDGDGAPTAPPTIWLSSARVVPDGRFRRYVSYTPGHPIGDIENW
jgi:ketosteroid isomerase-like protein